MSENLRSIFRVSLTTPPWGELADHYRVFKYEAKDHENPRCVAPGIPLEDAQLFLRTLLK